MLKPLAIFFSVLFYVSAANNQGHYAVTARYPVPGTATWDYVTVDSETQRLYIAHGMQVDVLDTASGALIGSVKETPAVHGIAIAGDLNRGFTSNGGDDSVTIFDPRTFSILGKVKVGSRPDRIYYDKPSRRVFTCNHGSNDVTAIDAKSGSVIGLLRINGGCEQLVPAPGEKVYAANADTSEVFQFDPATLKVITRYPLGACKEPHGLAFDSQDHRLFAACRNKLLIVLDSLDGHEVSSLPIGDTVDMAAFDPQTRTVFASNGDGTLSLFRQVSPDQYQSLISLKTGPNAKQMDMDPKTSKLYLPSGRISQELAGDGKPVKTVQEGTFAILVVGR